MKRTLGFCLLLGLAVPGWAQTSQPTNVKVVAVPASKPSAAKPAPKPAVIAVKPASKPTVAVVPAKPANQNPQANAKPAVSVVPAKPAAPNTKEQAKPTVAVAPAKGAVASHVTVAAKADQHPAKAITSQKAMTSQKPVVAVSASKDPFSKNKKPQAVVAAPVTAKNPEKTGAVVAVKDSNSATEKKPEPKKVNASARRDPFISPVVHMAAAGSGCSSGKRCLAIDQIALKGVVRSENGMIAVVVNAMDKAYFLRENDPVFNGYVTKITPDSIVFKETFHDKLGKELTRDITKTISRPAA